jgi:hypothetical protein
VDGAGDAATLAPSTGSLTGSWSTRAADEARMQRGSQGLRRPTGVTRLTDAWCLPSSFLPSDELHLSPHKFLFWCPYTGNGYQYTKCQDVACLNPQIFLGSIPGISQGACVMMGFETLAIVLFIGWILATSLFLRFG